MVAASIVRWRDARRSTAQLMDERVGCEDLEQSAGFLRIRDGDNPLDQSGVHPETYPLVERLLGALNKPAAEVMGRSDVA